MNYKIYLSDEGFGHLVRQRAIYEELLRMNNTLSATVQTSTYADAARRIFHNATFINKFNNISWPKQANGAPDLAKIKCHFDGYAERSNQFIAAEENSHDYEFLISDFVYEAFPVAQRANVPAFGVAHFTWDWFFSRMYPIPVSMNVLDRLQCHAKQADAIYFPPFTPEEILIEYKKIAKPVPFIVNKRDTAPVNQHRDRFTIMIMDSGADVLRRHIELALDQIRSMDDVCFVLSEKYGIRGDNIKTIPEREFLSDYIPNVDLVVTRGGFNTISECIAYRVPLLLLGEPMNPEIERNLLYLKQEDLGSFISLENFVNRFDDVLSKFIENEYKTIKSRMDEHEYETNGAEVVAEDILERVSA